MSSNLNPDVAEKLRRYIRSLRGGVLIRSTEVEGRNVTITFCRTAAEVAEQEPASRITERDFREYFLQGWAIPKIFVGHPGYLFRKFEWIDRVTVIIPFATPQKFSVTRAEFIDWFKVDPSEVDQVQWQRRFNDTFVYARNNRDAAVKRFGIQDS